MEEAKIIAEAQARLLQKRATETATPTLSIVSSQNDIAERLAKRKCRHGNLARGCAECEIEYQAAEAKRIADQEKAESERIENIRKNPGLFLSKFGVPKGYIGCSFENFKSGDKAKQLLIDASRESILLSGKTGCGKTHLAVALLNNILPVIADLNVRFETAPEILLSIRSCFSKNADEKELVGRYTSPEILVVDDLGADKATEWAISTMYLIFDYRIRELKQTIVTTNLNMQEIENQYGARIASRLSIMKIINLQMPDYRKRR